MKSSKKKMKARVLSERVMRAIDAEDGIWSDHALDEADRLGLSWPDVVEVARTPESIKKERDAEAADGYKYALIGRGRGGRRLYMAGKVVCLEEVEYWKVVTFHEAK